MVHIASTSAGIIRNLPAPILARLAIGQQIVLTVTKAVLATETIVLRIANELVELQTPVDLKQGQQIRLALVKEEGKPVLKLVSTADEKLQQSTGAIKHTQGYDIGAATPLQKGQLFGVQVVKVLAQNQLLVQMVDTKGQSVQQIEIDSSQLKQSFHEGQRLWVKVVNTDPLHIQFLPKPIAALDHGTRSAFSNSGQLRYLSQFLSPTQSAHFPPIIREAVDRLLAHTLKQSEITDLSRFKRAIVSSGFMMENTLVTKGEEVKGDFKANLSHVLQAVETVMNEIKGNAYQSELRKLPAYIQQALQAKGATPVQLLKSLLTGYRLAPPLFTQSFSSLIKSQSEALNLARLITQPLTLLSDNPQTQLNHKFVTMNELMQLFKEVEALQDKVVLNQLHMLNSRDTNSPVLHWLFELPVKNKNELNLIQMQIDQFKEKAHDTQFIWNVSLRLDTQNLGPVQANIILDRGDVKLVLKAERSDSAQLLNNNLDVLHMAMENLGLSMSQSYCYCAQVEAITPHQTKQSTDNTLVDIRI